MTGRRSDGDCAAVQTFRYRQSSLAAGESGRSTDTFRRPMPFGCTQTSPNVSALRTPLHFAIGCGARHRCAPTGGAAKGTPLNTRTPGADADVPESRPASVLTGSGTLARKPPAITRVAANATPVAAMLPFGNPAIFIVSAEELYVRHVKGCRHFTTKPPV